MPSLLQLPETPRRGRSRFSKALPIPPPPQIIEPIERTATTPHSPLPPLPIMATNAVTRRPVGGQTHVANTSVVSMNSVSSVYSDSPGFTGESPSTSAGLDTKDSPSGIESSPGISPPLPPKAPQRPRPDDLNEPIAIRDGFQPSPPRTELWRRRSLTRENAVAFPDLQLEMSNGSTATPPQKEQLPTLPNPLPRSIGGRKPVPLQKDHTPLRGAPQPPAVMGNKLSKLEEKLLKLTHNDKTNNMKATESQRSPVQPLSGRLPTPDYQRTDKQQPSTPKIMSPISPETPPNDAPQLPDRSESRNLSEVTLVPGKDLPPSLSISPSEPLNISSTPAMRSPQPRKALPIPILTPELSPSTASQPTPTLHSPTALQSPGLGGNFVFPKQLRSPLGTVLPGLPLNITQLDCFTSHASMRKTTNKLCPVACMVCKRKDMDSRWKCSWCCVSACAGCMQILEKIEGKDLRKVQERVGR